MSVNLFKHIKVGRMDLQHRVTMAPLTRMRAPNNTVSDLHSLYYSQRSSRPGTLIITEATFISEAASGYPLAPGIWRQDQIDAWKKVFDAIHANKSYVYVQLWALGRAAFKSDLDARGLPYVSASDVPESTNNPDAPVPRPLTVDEIKEYVKNYVQAAKNAIEAGADGVEIHSTNGYLLDQFLHENTNKRTDQYGGSIENRARFTLEVVDAVTEAIGADRVGIRLSPWNLSNSMEHNNNIVAQFAYVTGELQKRAEAGKELSYIHFVEPRWITKGGFNNVIAVDGNNDFVRSVWKGIFMRAGGYNRELAIKHTNEDDKVLIAMGRYFISTPDLVNRWEQNIELNPYNRATFYSSRNPGYTDYPFTNEIEAKA